MLQLEQRENMHIFLLILIIVFIFSVVGCFIKKLTINISTRSAIQKQKIKSRDIDLEILEDTSEFIFKNKTNKDIEFTYYTTTGKADGERPMQIGLSAAANTSVPIGFGDIVLIKCEKKLLEVEYARDDGVLQTLSFVPQKAGREDLCTSFEIGDRFIFTLVSKAESNALALYVRRINQFIIRVRNYDDRPATLKAQFTDVPVSKWTPTSLNAEQNLYHSCFHEKCELYYLTRL
jgi:hypothetical protein